jgi:uncharacterized protein YecE (DUF72 family)
VRVFVGTSGFSHDEWKGSFYPTDLTKDRMLAHYATELPSVEINNTFYRMPKPAVIAQWASAVPGDFRFALKASRRITHIGRLRDAGDPLAYLFSTLSGLGDRLGAVLFQLPPNLRRDDALLSDFLALLPEGCTAAMEFRHASWLDDAVFDALRRSGVALVLGDPEDADSAAPLVATADFGYLRLREAEYDEASIVGWAERIGELPWQRAFVYFKHETLGPAYAARLLSCFGAEARPGLKKVVETAPGLSKTRPAAAKKKRAPRR